MVAKTPLRASAEMRRKASPMMRRDLEITPMSSLRTGSLSKKMRMGKARSKRRPVRNLMTIMKSSRRSWSPTCPTPAGSPLHS